LNLGGSLNISGSFGNSGAVNVNAGTLTLNTPSTNNGTISIGSEVTLLANGASLTNSATGIIGGSGTILMGGTTPGAFVNYGVISPGAAGAVGTLTVLGDVTFGATGSLNIERFSNTSADQLAISGKATLSGTFGWTDRFSSLLNDGTAYPAMTYGSKTGTFTTMNLPFGYSANYLTDKLNIATPNLLAAGNSGVTAAANQVVIGLWSAGQLPALLDTGGTTGTAGTTGSGATKAIVDCSSAKAKKLAGC
jgi:hypothetical protein